MHMRPKDAIKMCSNLAIVKSPFSFLICSDKAMLTLLPDNTGVDKVIEECGSLTVGLLLHFSLFSLGNSCFLFVNPGQFSTDGVLLSKLVLLMLNNLSLGTAPF